MKLVVAVGGNALLQRGEVPLVEIQEGHVATAVDALAPLAADHDLVITHGNGPQVGLLANESALDPDLPGPYPLDVLGAESQGMIGYFLLQAFQNALPQRMVVNLICQTEVAADDPAFENPTKPIGSFMDAEQAERRRREEGWVLIEDANRGYRRVVASPQPLRIVELPAIRSLITAGTVVITAGGGGIPVVVAENGDLTGVPAVIDKDLAAALLAGDLGADLLLITTAVEKVALNFGTPKQRWLDRLTLSEAKAYLASGTHFAKGSMAPKMQAMIEYLERGGTEGIITDTPNVDRALNGETGTRITRD